MKIKNKINVEVEGSNQEVIVIDGKRYALKRETTKKIGKTTHLDKMIYEPIDEEAYQKDIDFIVEKLKTETSVEEIIKDVLKHATPKDLKSVVKKLKEGHKPIKQRGCLGFEIGGRYLEITP